MLGKMAKYFFILYLVGVAVLVISEDMRVLYFCFFCFLFSFISFVGWVLNQPFVVRIDKSDR